MIAAHASIGRFVTDFMVLPPRKASPFSAAQNDAIDVVDGARSQQRGTLG